MQLVPETKPLKQACVELLLESLIHTHKTLDADIERTKRKLDQLSDHAHWDDLNMYHELEILTDTMKKLVTFKKHINFFSLSELKDQDVQQAIKSGEISILSHLNPACAGVMHRLCTNNLQAMQKPKLDGLQEAYKRLQEWQHIAAINVEYR